MSRQKYQLKPEDVPRAQRWILERVIKRYWPEGITSEAYKQFPMPNEKTTAKKLQKWCDRHLPTEHWPRLQNALRQHRRDLSGYRTVRLTQSAHAILETLANRDHITLSEAVECYYHPVLDSPAEDKTASSAPSQPKTTLKRLDSSDGWQVWLDGKEIGNVRKYTIHGYPRDSTGWRAYQPGALTATEHKKRADAVKQLVRESIG